MDQTEIYLGIIKDSFMAGILIPVKGELYLPSVIAYGQIDPLVPLILGYIASSLGLLSSFWIGRFLMGLILRDEKSISEEGKVKYARICKLFNRYVIWIIGVSALIPLAGPYLILVAGMLRGKIAIVIGLTLISRAIFYYHSYIV